MCIHHCISIFFSIKYYIFHRYFSSQFRVSFVLISSLTITAILEERQGTREKEVSCLEILYIDFKLCKPCRYLKPFPGQLSGSFRRHLLGTSNQRGFDTSDIPSLTSLFYLSSNSDISSGVISTSQAACFDRHKKKSYSRCLFYFVFLWFTRNDHIFLICLWKCSLPIAALWFLPSAVLQPY